MTTKNLIIYKFNVLYHILEELGLDLNINVTFAETENSLNECVKNLNNWIKLINHHEWDAFIEQIIFSYYDPLYNKSLNQNYRIDFKIQSNKNTFKENINFIFDKLNKIFLYLQYLTRLLKCNEHLCF